MVQIMMADELRFDAPTKKMRPRFFRAAKIRQGENNNNQRD
jgi:hypothetical protein